MDVLPCNGLTISNVEATYDSKFLNDIYPGLRFPSVGYKNLKLENVSLEDVAESTKLQPIYGSGDKTNDHVIFKAVRVTVNRWEGKGDLPTIIAGSNNDVVVEHIIKAEGSRLVSAQQGTVFHMLKATPSTLKGADSTVLSWTSKQADTCIASGAWSGTLGSTGSRTVNLATLGNREFILDCKGVNDFSHTSLRAAVRP
jgi:hypothetical protein